VNLFEVFPQLHQHAPPQLQERVIRLIGLSALPYDAEAWYFRISAPKFWARADGQLRIGVDGAQCRPQPDLPPLQLLSNHLRREWRARSAYFPAGQAYLLEAEALTSLPGATLLEPTTPFLLILTPPRLGGGEEIPDALAQASYLMPVTRAPRADRLPGLLRIARAGLEPFLAQEQWSAAELRAQPWARLELSLALPQQAALRPILALRSLQQLYATGELTLSLDAQQEDA